MSSVMSTVQLMLCKKHNLCCFNQIYYDHIWCDVVIMCCQGTQSVATMTTNSLSPLFVIHKRDTKRNHARGLTAASSSKKTTCSVFPLRFDHNELGWESWTSRKCLELLRENGFLDFFKYKFWLDYSSQLIFLWINFVAEEHMSEIEYWRLNL